MLSVGIRRAVVHAASVSQRSNCRSTCSGPVASRIIDCCAETWHAGRGAVSHSDVFGFVASDFFGGLAIAAWGGCAVYFAERIARETRASRLGRVFFVGFLLRIIYWPWNVRIIGAALVLAGLFVAVMSIGATPT